jgi:MFS family permease
MLMAGLALFSATSLGVALVRSPWLLLSARALAGLGAALALPAALGLIIASIPEGRLRDRALGYMSASIDAAMVAGAVLGGLVTFALGWPWVFLLVGFAAAAEAAAADKGTAAGLFQTFTHVGGAVVLAGLVVAFAAAGRETALMLGAALLAAGAVVAWALLRNADR